MKHWIYFVFLFLLSRTSQAQDSTVRYTRPITVLAKLAPLAFLLDPDATIQAGAEMRISTRNSVQFEAGFGRKGFAIVTDDKENFTDWSVWRVRSEWRHYTNRYRTNKRKNIRIRSDFPLGNYIAIEGFIKQIDGKKNSRLYTPESTYSTVEQSINRFVWGSHIKWGRQLAFPGATPASLSRVLLDFYGGIGIRYGSTQTNPVVESCGCGFSPSRFAQGSFLSPSIAAGLKIVFLSSEPACEETKMAFQMGPGNLLTSYWPVFDQLTSPVLVGTSSNNKTYFIDRTSQLLEYTSNVGSFRYNYQS